MYLESDGRNELQLLNVGFPDFILSVARTHLKGASSREIYDDLQPILISKIVIWLLSLALSRRKCFVSSSRLRMNAIWTGFILTIPDLGREELYALIFPYILSSEKVSWAVSLPSDSV
jgi:hypothetical protein